MKCLRLCIGYYNHIEQVGRQALVTTETSAHELRKTFSPDKTQSGIVGNRGRVGAHPEGGFHRKLQG